MDAKLYDVVELKDGRVGTIVHVYPGDEAFMLEISDTDGRALDLPDIKKEDITKITYIA